ncbi:C4-type zinc ribbon domain-containing protein [Thermobifida fusca]|uniref:C4-type zinc ribbon domain-containing protein n=3 Tax=Thermobifida fusca TaxID=2021 RepID=A0A9P2TA95_THEFU|nr:MULTISPECIES: C4-type zinc ribbon domain-containing protein [Thermobifida]AAZ55987.1 similar to Zn-ribbon protein possibly nucleic acid-binding [Thermobifida fusca YX]EOR71033.1 hypothetical protein TM51_10061 [Thermobifida fusca TM51]MBO2530578.1 hypothetical protein [Thermobifida sp.]MDD6791004.1 C4-type zinc ribbon domain-containing protein [Thermobifida fusca]PPS91949.1 Zn-ribbon-like protein [Thermobifida fusca]
MKAEPAHQLRLLDLQETDTERDRLNRLLRALPEEEQLRQCEARLTELRDQLAVTETELRDLDREQRKVERDIDQVRARAERNTQRMESGQISSPRELESLQAEIELLARRQSELEDIALELMERREEADKRRADLDRKVTEAVEERDDAENRRSEAVLRIKDELDSATQRRSRIVKELPEDLLNLYERLREQYAGIGAAALRYGRCEGCKLQLSAAELREMRLAPPEEVTRCENCRRILVRVADSGL